MSRQETIQICASGLRDPEDQEWIKCGIEYHNRTRSARDAKPCECKSYETDNVVSPSWAILYLLSMCLVVHAHLLRYMVLHYPHLTRV